MKFWIVDAFTNKIFRGNPAAVCVLDRELSSLTMQNIAAEFNLSETAFVQQTEDQSFDLRWFTPKCEVELCGHATLATSAALADQGYQGPYAFNTKSGLLHVTCDDNSFALDFPSQGIFSDFPQPMTLEGLEIVNQTMAYDDVIIEVCSAEQLQSWCPNIPQLANINCRGIIITAQDLTGEFDFISRFFAPRVGVNEDPVTGSAHCKLAPYWAQKLGKTTLRAFQASQRGGVINLRLKEDRVILEGSAVIVGQGTLSQAVYT